jgi:hypothetical protein
MFKHRVWRNILVLMAVSNGCAVAQNSVAALKSRLMAPPATVTLNANELRLSKINHADVRVEGGQIHLRLANTMLKVDTDVVAHRNDLLHVKSVDTTSDGKNDYLRVTVASDNGSSAPVAFTLPKGELATTTELTLEQLIAPIFTRASDAAQPMEANAPTASPERPRQSALSPLAAPNTEPATLRKEEGSKIADDFVLPAAGPGLPEMHIASDQGQSKACWKGYYSKKFGLEIASIVCSPNPVEKPFLLSDNLNSIRGSQGEFEKPKDVIRVYIKPADQDLKVAIQQQLIDPLKEPGAKRGCKITGPEELQPGLVKYQIEASPAYAKEKAHACRGLATDNTEEAPDDYYILARPSESTTKFVVVTVSEAVNPYDVSSIHFQASNTSANATSQPAEERHAVGQSATLSRPVQIGPSIHTSIPPMPDVWLSQGKLQGVDLANEASTVVSFTHGLMLDSSAGSAIVAITCEQTKAGDPALFLHVDTPIYRGMQTTLTNSIGTLLIGNSNRKTQLSSHPGSRFLDIAVPLDANDAAALSGTNLAHERKLSLMYFNGAGQDIAAGDVPPANDALDAVLNACHVLTPPRLVMQPQQRLSPEEISHLTLAKLSLGMATADAKQALGTGYRFLPSQNTQEPSISYLLASDPSGGYGMTFVNGALKAFTYRQFFLRGSEPLVLNLIHGVTEKTWLPLTGSSAAATSWSTDSSDVPIDLVAESKHPRCREVTGDNPVAPAEGGFSRLALVRLTDAGDDCGVIVELNLQPANEDHSLAHAMTLLVADDAAIHSVIKEVANQRQQQQQNERKRADQIANPF